MKYGNTSRTLSLVFHLLILLAFGVMGFYYGIFVTPFALTRSQIAFTNSVVWPFNFSLQLAVLGLSMFVISIYGFIQALKAIMNPSDDKPVVKAFTTFIIEGYIAAIFCLANACIYFDLLSFNNKDNITFIIIISLILAIGLLIATNIPMYKLFDGQDPTALNAGFNFGAAVVAGVMALELVASLGAGYFDDPHQTGAELRFGLLLGGALVNLAVLALTLVAGLKVRKAGAADKKVATLAGSLDSGAIFLVGALILSLGIVDFYFRDESNYSHFEGVNFGKTATGTAYAICSIVFGAIIIAGSIFFLVTTLNPNKKEAAK
jgi:hypothetical protein